MTYDNDWLGSAAADALIGTPRSGDAYYDGMDMFELAAQWGLEGKDE